MRADHLIADMIAALGERDFVGRTTIALCGLVEFDLAAVVLHREDDAVVLFDTFDTIGGRGGLDTYVRHTRRINPMIVRRSIGAVRARDFGRRDAMAIATMDRHCVASPGEELGFRTRGWPERMEEVALHCPVQDGIVEIGVYRARGRRPSASALRTLDRIARPVAAAFDRHLRLGVSFPASLTPRETEVCECMLAGWSSPAIALRLGIGLHTVKDHRKRVFRKLGVGSLAELFALGYHRPPRWRDGAGRPGPA